MTDFDKYKTTLKKLKYYVYALCELTDEERRPFYIGKGVNSRCLQHIYQAIDINSEEIDEELIEELNEKKEKIETLYNQNKLGIDILRHGMDEETAFVVEATCIDLLGIDSLTNKVRGKATKLGRLSLNEIHDLHTDQQVDIKKEHSGLAFLLNKRYKSGMDELSLFEITRGVWANIPRNDTNIKYAYATYNNIIREVYEVHGWVKAGTQQYFTRDNIKRDSERWEFIGRKAEDSVRKLYVGKVINKDRSYGTPFVKVGY